MSDAINPDHYKRLPAEAIEIIEAMIAGAPDNKAAYLHGQAAKYDLRLWRKGESLEDYLADLGKHIWYALRLESHLLELIEKQKANEQQKASDLQSLKGHWFEKLKEPAWTPRVGDWVKINAPEQGDPMHTKTLEDLDGKILQVVGLSEFDKRYAAFESDHGSLYVLIDLLKPADQPKATVEVNVEVTGEVKNPLGCPDGWRFLEVGEVIRKGDKYRDLKSQTWIEVVAAIGDSLQDFHKPTIRRNRFEVGEKVVSVFNGVVYKVIRILSMGYQLESEFCAEVILYGKDLAPYIEETT